MMKLTFQNPFKSIHPFKEVELPDFCVLTGKNGAGKTHLLQAIQYKSINFSDIEFQKIVYFDLHSFIIQEQSKTHISTFSRQKKDQFEKFSVMREAYLLSKYQEISEENIKAAVADALINEMQRQNPKLMENAMKGYPKISYEVAQENLQRENLHIVQGFLKFCSGKNLEEIANISIHTAWLDVSFPFHHDINSLSDIFFDYKENLIAMELPKKYGGGGKSSVEIAEFESRAPWNVLYKLLKILNMPHEFTIPKFRYAEIKSGEMHTYQVQLSHEGAVFNFDDLSSGEKVLFKLALEVFSNERGSGFPDLLLLDEIDATLHASMIKKFIEVIEDIFIANGCKVILATHSPTTAALVDESVIFEVRAGAVEDKIQKVSKKQAISILGEGFMTLEEGLTIFDQISKKNLTIISEGYNFKHIKKAISILGKELLNDIYFIEELPESTGETQLKMLFDLFSRIPREKPVLFIFDCDVKIEKLEQNDKTYCFAFEKNEENTLAEDGIENLYSKKICEAYPDTGNNPKTGARISFAKNCKNDLLNDILQLNDPNEFKNYQPLVSKIKEILKSTQ